MQKHKLAIAVIGGNKCNARIAKIAEDLGKEIARLGASLVCGGLGGVMEAACRGAKSAGGETIGILPGNNKEDANPFVDIKIPTGLGYARNILVVKTADIVVAVDGKYGTLSEIAHALQMGKTVIGIETWEIEGVVQVESVGEAVQKIKEGAKKL
jgi:uncharacterized protein (TIGR00725 family)